MCGMSVRMYIPERVSRVCNYHNTEGFFVSHFLNYFSDLMHSYKSTTHTNNNFITLAVVVTAAPLCFLTNTKGPGKPPDELRLSVYHLPRSVSTS